MIDTAQKTGDWAKDKFNDVINKPTGDGDNSAIVGRL